MSGSIPGRIAPRSSPLSRGITCAALVLLATRALTAQPTNVGRLSEIRSTHDKQPCTVTGTAMPIDPVRVGTGITWRTVDPNLIPIDVNVNERIAVRREVAARLFISEGPLGADISLSPKLACSFLAVDARAGVLADSGAYQLARAGRDTIVFTVNRGAAYIRWTDPAHQCLLNVVALLVRPIRARVCGTQLVVSVDANGTNGFLYVAEGTVLVTGAAGVVPVNQGQLVRLGPQADVTLVDPTATSRVDLQEIDYHSRDVWGGGGSGGGGGFFKSATGPIVGGGAIIGGILVLKNNWNPWFGKHDASLAGPFRKTIVIHIPL